MNELVARLREHAEKICKHTPTSPRDHIAWEAANEIELLWEDQWLPIETAPKDEWLLGFCVSHGATLPIVMIHTGGMNKGVFSTSDEGVCFPTHWMPLPPPPETTE